MMSPLTLWLEGVLTGQELLDGGVDGAAATDSAAACIYLSWIGVLLSSFIGMED